MSGGTDSSLAAYLLTESGWLVKGFTLRLATVDSPKASEQHVLDAQRVAEKLGLEHHVVDMRELFEQEIVAPFAEEYASSRTPSPCVRCNRRIKFGALWELVAKHGCSRLATGHYARLCTDDTGRRRLLRGCDGTKDQSYFLAALTQEQLQAALFPLGELEKSEVRVVAKRLGLVPHGIKESQDLCFVPDGDFAAHVAARRPDLLRAGDIVDLAGKVLGQHEGAFRYTTGQRKGLGLSGGPWYVVKVDVPANTVVVGCREDIRTSRVSIREVNWQRAEPSVGESVDVVVQLRYSTTPVAARLQVLPEQRAMLELATPFHAATPGQFAVFYDADWVLGGGWIEESAGL